MCRLLLPLLILATQPATALPIFTWVDDSGVTHFSETAPPVNQTDSRRIELEVPPPARADPDDYYSVVNQAARMQSRRLESEKLAAEKQQAMAEARRARAEAAAIQSGDWKQTTQETRYYPVFGWYPRYRHPHRKPGHGNKPGHGHKPGHGNRPGHDHRPAQPVVTAQVRARNPRMSLGKTPGMPRR